MEIITTSKDIIARIEDALVRQANYGIHVKSYIAEALIEIENDGQTEKFRLREFSNNAKKEHAKILKELSGIRTLIPTHSNHLTILVEHLLSKISQPKISTRPMLY